MIARGQRYKLVRVDIAGNRALNRQWSATAMRDQNGIFSVNLIYKKQFR
jgi:hypothetical protein